MAKKSSITPPSYFKSLTIEKVKCFKDKQTLDLSGGNSKPSQWTVIIGNNGTGKTTILQCLAGLEPVLFESFISKGNIQFNSAQKGKVIPNISGGGLKLASLDSNYTIQCSIFFGKKLTQNNRFQELKNFGIKSSKMDFTDHFQKIGNLKVYYYPANRSIKKVSLTKEDLEKGIETTEILDAEEWLMQLDYASRKGAPNAKPTLNKVKKILINVLPEIKALRPKTKEGQGFSNYVEAETPYAKVPLKELSYGYLVMIAWIVDLAKKMVDRYPESPNPLSEPAVVLVDEIDLHMHPEWQRNIIGFLSKHFSNTQFIVTAHNPLIVQSVDKVNIVLLQRDNDKTKISNHVNKSFKGWSVEEVLNDLMGMEKTKSDQYISLIKQFEDAQQKEDSKKARIIFNELNKILHPNNDLRKLLSIQIASLGK